MKKNLTVKDLVTIGVFAVVYFVLMFGIGMMGMLPILFLVFPTALGIVSGVVVMLLMAKIQKPWALFIFGLISPIVMFAGGHTYIVLVHAVIIMLIAEIFRRMGNYTSFKYNTISFAIFNTWICGSLMQMLLAKEKYLEMTLSMMGEEYTNTLEHLITYPNMALVYLGAVLGGVIGAFIGKALLKKHFIKAGIA